MAEKKKTKKTTSKDVPGSGLAKKAGKALEGRRSRIEEAEARAMSAPTKKKKKNK